MSVIQCISFPNNVYSVNLKDFNISLLGRVSEKKVGVLP